MKEMTPRQIVAELDKYVIGQDDAKKSVAIALRNRWRRRNADEEIRDEIIPNNIIMIGPTGVGKTEIARRLARLAEAPFVKVEATKFTEVGYVGRDVDSMIRDLTDVAINMVRAEQTARVRERAVELAEERILDLLIPPAAPRKDAGVQGPGFVLQPGRDTDADASVPSDEHELRERTREKFREKLKRGDLDKREIEIDVAADQPAMMQVFGPMGIEEMGLNLQDMFGNLTGKRRKKRRLNVTEAREVLTNEEAEKLVDMEAVTKEALDRVQQAGIVFIDEIDKVAAPSAVRNGSPDVSRQGVQRDLLPIVEGSTVTTKYGLVKTDHILFIASGAFHSAKPSDLIPELQGRFPIRVELSSLSESDFVRILTEPRNALLKQYQALLASEGVDIWFSDDAVKAIARIAAEVNDQVENIGARRLHTILTTLLEEILFEVPDMHTGDRIEITEDLVEERLAAIARNRDLSEYVL
ncbi:MAG TPA: ATP-dependent protease ATPase subunit HslU [Rhodothermia bacterium]